MIELFRLILHIMTSLFKPRAKLAAAILVLRQQLNVIHRQLSKRPQLSNTDRLLFVWLYRWFPSVLGAIAILRPETIIRWHRTGFRSYWRGRSRKPVGRPRISAELRTPSRRPWRRPEGKSPPASYKPAAVQIICGANIHRPYRSS
jgi:hypothetical protein